MASICTGCTTRYATGLSLCPHCQSPDRYDEHGEVAPAAAEAPVEVSPDSGESKKTSKTAGGPMRR